MYRTGDLVRYLLDGNLSLGRNDSQLRGVRLSELGRLRRGRRRILHCARWRWRWDSG